MSHKTTTCDLNKYTSNTLHRKLRVLALDNEEPTLTALSFLIEAMGHSVDIFTSSTDALDSFEENTFDLALIDYRLSGEFDGAKIIIKINKLNTDTLCFLVTGDYAIENNSENIEIISKPLTDRKLKHIFHHVDAFG